MKISNLLLASIIASSVSLSAQVDNTKKDSLASKKTCKIKNPNKKTSLTRKDSIEIKKLKSKLQKEEGKRLKSETKSHRYCPPCGLG